MTSKIIHKPVLLNEVIALLDPQPGECFIDGTLGGGGYAQAIIEKIGKTGTFVGFDWDSMMFTKAARHLSNLPDAPEKLLLVNDNFTAIHKFLEREGIKKADGVVLDLGWASDQLEEKGRGFSFGLKEEQEPEPLLMTVNDQFRPVRDLIKEFSEEELAEIIREFSEERYANRIAAAIKSREERAPITTNVALRDVIVEAVPKNYEHGRIHPATRTFMALRIFANQELGNLESFLKDLSKIVASRGRVAVVTFHSLEDRVVKNYFKQYVQAGDFELMNKKPIQATKAEINENRRARSAKVRGISKL